MKRYHVAERNHREKARTDQQHLDAVMIDRPDPIESRGRIVRRETVPRLDNGISRPLELACCPLKKSTVLQPPLPLPAKDQEMPFEAPCPAEYFGVAASLADTERPNDQRVPAAARSSNLTPHAPTRCPRSAPAQTWWKFAFAAVLCIATAGQTKSETAGECAGQIVKVVERNITMTMLKDDAGAPRKEKIKEKGSAMKMPLCVLRKERKKGGYRIRLPGGGEALIPRRYVLDATDKPPIVINCDGYTVYMKDQEGGVRGSGEDPCD